MLEWPHWLRLWHFAAGMLLSLGVAAAALAYDHPALFDGEAMVSAIGATGRLLTPAQVAWQLLTSSTPFFDLALRLALDNSAVTAAATAAARRRPWRRRRRRRRRRRWACSRVAG